MAEQYLLNDEVPHVLPDKLKYASKLQSDAFVRLQTFLPLVIVIYFKIVLRKHSSEACERQLCLVFVCIF